MKFNFKNFNHKLIENGFFERFPLVTLVPSKVKSFYKRKWFTKDDLVFYTDVKETKALFKEEGFPERIVNSVPKLIKRVDRIRPALDRLAKC